MESCRPNLGEYEMVPLAELGLSGEEIALLEALRFKGGKLNEDGSFTVVLWR